MFNKRKEKWEKLREAIRQDDTAQVTSIIGDLEGKAEGKEYINACTLAIENNTPNALRALLKAGRAPGLIFHQQLDRDRRVALSLLEAARASSNPAPLFCVLYDMNEATTDRDHRLKDEDFLSKEMPDELIQRLLKKNPNYEGLTKQEASVQKEAVNEPAQVIEGFSRLNDYTLSEVQKLPNGSTLTTLFNFSSKQQEKYTKNEAGDIFHSEPVNFSKLDDGVVDEMRARLDALAEPAPQPPAAANDGYRKFRSAI